MSNPPPETSPSTLRAAAEEYARLNWAVFPLKPKDKTPLTRNGVKDASTNLDTIRRWWGRWPSANIGLNCGKSGIVAVDLDKRDDHDGTQEWAALCAREEAPDWGETPVSITGSGGWHLLFDDQGQTVPNSAGKLALHVDTRGADGYIVLPPSIHPNGQPYRWQNDHLPGLAPLPEFVRRLLTTTEPLADPWPIYTLADAFAPRPPLVWIVKDILAEATVNLWFGAPGTLKSMLLADLCVCVATGRPWLLNPNGQGGYATASSPVMWLDFDNGQRRTHERFEALARAHQTGMNAPLYYVSMPEPRLDAGDPQHLAELADRLAVRGVRLLVIDNLGVISGNRDENSAEMQAPMAGLRWLAEQTGASVNVLHHERKSNGLSVRAGDHVRGHSSIEANLDLGERVTREEEGNNVTVAASKVRGYDVKTYGATFSYETDDNHELVTARFFPWDHKSVENKAQLEMQANIIDTLRRLGPLSANKVFDQVGGNRAETLDLLRTMVRVGQLGQKQGAQSYLLYVPGG